jgi:hypothetical protein
MANSGTGSLEESLFLFEHRFGAQRCVLLVSNSCAGTSIGSTRLTGPRALLACVARESNGLAIGTALVVSSIKPLRS